MDKKSDKHEIDRRVNEVVKLISNAKTSSYVCEHARIEWGVSKSQAHRYLERAREIIRQDYSVERSDFLASRLALLDKIADASIKSGQHSNAVGALRLQAQLTQLING